MEDKPFMFESMMQYYEWDIQKFSGPLIEGSGGIMPPAGPRAAPWPPEAPASS